MNSHSLQIYNLGVVLRYQQERKRYSVKFDMDSGRLDWVYVTKDGIKAESGE